MQFSGSSLMQGHVVYVYVHKPPPQLYLCGARVLVPVLLKDLPNVTVLLHFLPPLDKQIDLVSGKNEIILHGPIYVDGRDLWY